MSLTSLAIILVAILALKLIIDYLVASYGSDQGFPFVPLFVSSFFLGFPLVLLAIAVGTGRRRA